MSKVSTHQEVIEQAAQGTVNHTQTMSCVLQAMGGFALILAHLRRLQIAVGGQIGIFASVDHALLYDQYTVLLVYSSTAASP